MAAFVAVVALSRLPLLGGGYGSDDDAWRNVVAALRMRELGHYVPSRAPGFPVFESLLAVLAPFGWLATNGATALAGVVAALLFYRLALRLGVHAPGTLSLGFAFCSGLWITTGQTMDYAYGLALTLAAYLALLDRRHLAGGILLALAAGCRVTLGAQLLGAATLLLTRHVPARAWMALLGGFGVTLALEFIPVLRSPELGNLRREAAYHVSHAHVTLRTLAPFTRSALVFTFGRFGRVVLALAGLAIAWEWLRTRGSAASKPGGNGFERGAVAYELWGIVVTVCFFMMVPYENAYMLPALPFALLLLARALRPAWIGVLATVLMIEPLATVEPGTWHIVPGQLFQERARRRADVAETRALAALEPNAPTVFVVGRFRVHRLLVLEPLLGRLPPAWQPFTAPGMALWRPVHRVGYAQALTDTQRDSLQRAGYHIQTWPPEESPP